MKICIVTIIDNVNVGSYLQAFALAKIITNLGHKVELLDYSRPSRSNWHLFVKSFTNIKPQKWPRYWGHLIKRYRIINNQRQIIINYLSSKHYVGNKSVKKHPPKADVYLTGSDQVWNSTYNQGIDGTFYLDFAADKARRIAYASSIGMSDIPENERNETRKLLERYQAISVRESSSKDILQNLGIDGNRISFVLDPTLLLDKVEWEEQTALIFENEPYLLIYTVEQDKGEEINAVSHFIASKKNLKVVLMTNGTDSKRIKCDSHIKYINPFIFLSLFAHSSYVVVSSFHGTAFAINFEKDFVTVAPNMFNSRVDSLLKLCDLQERIFSSSDTNLDKYLDPVEFKTAREKISNMREKSIDFLRTNL